MISDSDGELMLGTPNPDLLASQRKVRKGTRSCWECKRRKIRCIFPSSGDAACVCCQRRRVPCVSQEIPESLALARQGNRGLSDRIARIEDTLKDLLAGKDVGSASHIEEEPLQKRQSHSYPSGLKPLSKTLRRLQRGVKHNQLLSHGLFSDSYLDSHRTLSSSALLASASPGVSDRAEADIKDSHPLWAAFPSDDDVRILFPESLRTSRYTLLVNTQPHAKFTHETLGSPYPSATCSAPNRHPVILAKRMLIYAEPPGVIGRRLVTAAVTWLTTQEETHSSVESLICIMLEAIFETNCGNIRKAWVIYRRVMTIEQAMGLHRSPIPPLRCIDPTFDADPKFMWFRIVYMDRYLSLLLGLP